MQQLFEAPCVMKYTKVETLDVCEGCFQIFVGKWLILTAHGTLLLGLPLDPRWKGWDDILKLSKLKSDAHAVQVKASYVPVTVDFERYADTTSAS